MANEFITMQNIAREILPLLEEALIMPETVNRNYSETFVGRGDTVQVEKPAVFVADEFGSTINLQEIGERVVNVKMDKIADVSFEISAKDLALKSEDFKTKYLYSAAQAIAEKVNKDGLNLYKDVPYFYGTSGTTPSSLTDIANARKILNENKAPMQTRYASWDPEAEAKFLQLDAIVNAEKSGSTEALRNGAIGNTMGFVNYMSQAIKTHTAGGYTSLADVTGTVVITNNANYTDGRKYSVAVLTSTAGAAVTKLLKGDILTLSGEQYTIVEDTADAIAGVVTAKLYPALKANVTAGTVVFPDVTARGHVANLAYQKDAFIFVTRPLQTPPGVESYTTSHKGLSLRVTMDYNISTKKTTMSIDMLYDYVTAYPELATRVLG